MIRETSIIKLKPYIKSNKTSFYEILIKSNFIEKWDTEYIGLEGRQLH